MDNVVVLAENLEGLTRQNQLDKKLWMANREIEFDELVIGLATHPDVTGHFVKRFGVSLSGHC